MSEDGTARTAAPDEGGETTAATEARRVFWWSIAFAALAAAAIPLFDATVLADPVLLPDQGASWYYWKLPPGEATFVTRLSAWVPYLVHQVLIWYFIWRLARSKKRWDGTLNRWNVAILATSAVAVVAHFVQTALFYDGLAQDVSVWSSQYSVIVMLALVLILRNRDRGLFFGRTVPLPKEGVRLTRRWHGYFIAWATVYTFWYHPVVSEWAHVIGFFYMSLLFIELGMAYTSVHRERWWTTALEVMVLVHGTTVALMTQQTTLWTMFFTGFAAMFIITQIYGMGLSKTAIRLASLGYLALTLYLYTFYPGGEFSLERLASIHQATWIPTIEYALVFAIAAALWAVSLITPGRASRPSGRGRL